MIFSKTVLRKCCVPTSEVGETKKQYLRNNFSKNYIKK